MPFGAETVIANAPLAIDLTAHAVAGPSAVIWLAATAPVIAWAGLLWRLSGSGAARAGLLVLALIAGALLAAWPASQLNQALLDWLAQVAGDASARRWVPDVAVPLVEEVAKAAVIALLVLLVPGSARSIGDGAVTGAAVGLGFTGAENVQYLTLAAIQGGMAGLWRATYVRGVLGGLHHATFAAFIGAGLAYARRAPTARRRWVGAALGLLAAVAQHIAWNISGAKLLADAVCGTAQPGVPCTTPPHPAALFVTAPLVSLMTVGPALVVLRLLVRRLDRLRAP